MVKILIRNSNNNSNNKNTIKNRSFDLNDYYLQINKKQLYSLVIVV